MTSITDFFKGWSRFKSNNLGLVLRMSLKFHSTLEKVLKLKVEKLRGLIPTFEEVAGEKWSCGTFLVHAHP